MPQFIGDSLVHFPDLVLELLGQQEVGALLLLELQEDGLGLAGLAVSGQDGGFFEELRFGQIPGRLLGKWQRIAPAAEGKRGLSVGDVLEKIARLLPQRPLFSIDVHLILILLVETGC